MSNIKNAQRFTEIEYALQKYFDGKVASVMKVVKTDLNEKQVKELADYQRSPAGILSMANPMGVDMSMSHLKIAGKWNSKTVEDYVAMCQQKLQGDKGFQKDLLTLAAEWRNAVVAKIGRAQYDKYSKQLGCDMAYAYVATRMDNLMIEKLVKDGMPKSTAEYILRKAAQGSIWGLEQELTKSPLAREIEARGEKAFNPSKGAKVAGKVGSSVIDAVSMGGMGSWKSLASFVGIDLMASAIFKDKPSVGQSEQVMETAISKGVFGNDKNIFTSFRSQTKTLHGKDNQYLNSLNSKLNNKIVTPYKPLMEFNLFGNQTTTWKPTAIPALQKPVDRTQGKYKNVPLIVAPGKEDAYLEAKAKADAEKKAQEARKTETTKANTKAEKPTAETMQTAPQNTPQSTTQSDSQQTTTTVDNSQSGQTDFGNTLATTASNGWEQLLQASGMKGMGDTAANLGYVVSMLPDVLIGMFTGKTEGLNMKNTMMPLASILLGMFVKNPILKLALIGFGGANLLNKAGKESLGWQHQQTQQANAQTPQFRQYADEPLNPRISGPVLQGTTLIANIDRVPCNIQLTENVVAAYHAGALPLNTLANAVLARYDATRMTAQQQYGQMVQQNMEQSQNETIHRTR